MATVSFTGVKSCKASGDAIDVVFKTRYSGDLAVTMTRACLGELVAALSQDAGAADAPAETLKPETAEPQGKRGRAAAAAETPAVAKPAATAAEPSPEAKSTGADAGVTARVPKRWAVGAETQAHKMVLVFFDPQTERQSTFALSPKAANQMAHALVEKAKVVSGSAAPRKDAAKS